MNSILILITAITFYLLGYHAGHTKESISQVTKTLQKRLNRVPAGVIDLPTPEQIKYEGSHQQKLDEAITKVWSKVLKK